MSVGAGIAGGYGETSTDSNKKIQNVNPEAAETEAQDIWRYGQARAQHRQFKSAAREADRYPSSEAYRLALESERQALQNQYNRASGVSPVLSPQEQALLDEYYGNMQRTGLADIQKFAQQQAAARGFSVADSPIYDESGRQSQELIRGLSADKAKQAFVLRDSNAAFNDGLAKFASNLRQQAWNNRLALATSPTTAQQVMQGMYGSRVGVAQEIRGHTDTSSWNVSGNVSAGYCWIAAAIYGEGTEEFKAARRFIFARWDGLLARLGRRAYRKYGQQVAWAVKHIPGVRALLKPLFDIAVRRGR